ncbi:hypothetical protein FOBRF1_006642 [Fusarium oxysporum]
MVQSSPDSEPVSSQGDTQKTPPSKKLSTYVFDSNGDTQLVLSTYKSQPLNWEMETIPIGRKSTKKFTKKKKQRPGPKNTFGVDAEPKANEKTYDVRDGKVHEASNEAAHSPDVEGVVDGTSISSLLVRTNSAEPQTSPSIPPSFKYSFSIPSDEFNIEFSRPEFSDDEKPETERTDVGPSADSSNLKVQDWGFGEKPGIRYNQVEIRMLVLGKHLELASSPFKKMLVGPFMEGIVDISGRRWITASGWDPEAFNIVLTIMHGYHRDVPKSLSLEMLTKLAMIVDYYDCHESLELYADIWL